VATEPYLSFEGCEFDKEIPIGGRVFRCQTYEYVYHCGKAEVLGARLSCKASRSRQPICARARITACGARWCPFRARTMDTAIVSLEPIRKDAIHKQRLGLVSRLSMMRIMARRTKAATVVA
jgi:hypothetical protein